MTSPVRVEGTVYQTDGSAIARLGQTAVMDFQIAEAAEGDGPFTPADLNGRFFVQRLFDRDAAVAVEVESEVVDDETVRFTLPLADGLLGAGVKAADLTYAIIEILEEGEDDVVVRPFSIRRLPAGLPGATLTVGPAERLVVRYVGGRGASAAQQAKDAGLIEVATGDALAAWLRAPALEAAEAANQAAALIVEANAAGLLPVQQEGDAQVARVEAAGNSAVQTVEITGSNQAAALEALTAERLADIAVAAAAQFYPTTAAGLAAVGEGGFFSTLVDGRITIWQDVAGVAVYRADLSNQADATAAQAAQAAAEEANAQAAASAAVFGELEATVEQLHTGSLVETLTARVGRNHSPSGVSEFIVKPTFAGTNLDTPVVPVSLTVTTPNLIDPDPVLWEIGQILTTGVNSASSSRLRMINPAPLEPGVQYTRSGGPYGRPVLVLYNAAGVKTRFLDITTGVPDTFVASDSDDPAIRETQYRAFFVKIDVRRADAAAAQLQLERGPVPTPWRAFKASTRVYDAVALYAYGGVADTVVGNEYVRRIERRTVRGTAAPGVFNLFSTIVTTIPDYYSANIQNPADFINETRDILIGRSDDGVYARNPIALTPARGLWFSMTAARVTVLRTVIDAMPGASTFAKFVAYLDAHPIEVIFDRAGWANTLTVGRIPLILPRDGSLILEATGTDAVQIDLNEVGDIGGGGGGAQTARIAALEGTATAQAALLAALEGQFNTLTLEGSIDPETAGARVSAFAVADLTLKLRLDRMERTAPVNVKDYGAKGDGETNDTAAMLLANAIAEASGRHLYFPRGVYMHDRGIRHITAKRMYGDGPGESILKKIAAVTSNVVGALSINQKTIEVEDLTGFEVGKDVYVGPDDSQSSYSGARGVITAVDPDNNTFEFDSYNSASGTGMVVAYAAGVAKASTTFPQTYTDNKVTPGTNILSPQFCDLEFDGNAQAGEPNAYTISPIHLDQQHVIAPVIFNVVFRNSPSDALSDQGNGQSLYAMIRMYGNRWHGIHIGFTTYGIMAFKIYAYGNGSDGMYFCYNNHKVLVLGYYFEFCPVGFKEIGGEDDDVIIQHGHLHRCGVDFQVTGSVGGSIQLLDFLSTENTGKVIECDGGRGLTARGVARRGLGVGAELVRTNHATIDVDWQEWLGTICVDVRNAGVTRSTGISIKGRGKGATLATVRVQSSDGVVFDMSHSEPANDTVPDILITADTAGAGQPASNGTICIEKSWKGAGIVNGGVNTRRSVLQAVA